MVGGRGSISPRMGLVSSPGRRERSASPPPPRHRQRSFSRSRSRSRGRGGGGGGGGAGGDRKGYQRGPGGGGGGVGGGGGGGYRSRSRGGRSHSRSPMSNRRRHDGNRVSDEPQPNKCLGVFGLSLRTTERDLKEVFSRYGPIEECTVVIDAQTGRSRGFSFIYFESMEDAKAAKESCNGIEIDGRRIRVDFSITQRAHTPTPGIYMGKPTVERRSRRRDDYRGFRRSPSPYNHYRGGGGGGGGGDRGGDRGGGDRGGGGGGGGGGGRRSRYSRSRSYSPRRY